MSKSEGPPPQAPNDHISALSALYQGEKADASVIFNTAMAMMGVAGAYLVGALSYIPNVLKLPDAPIPWILLLLPAPLWLIVAFHSLITLNAMSHGVSIIIIEDALFEASGLRAKRALVGSASGDKIMDITQSEPVHTLTTIFVYGGFAALVLLFTGYSLYLAKGLIHERYIWISSGAYLLVAVMVLRSWIAGFGIINKGRSEIPKRPHLTAERSLK